MRLKVLGYAAAFAAALIGAGWQIVTRLGVTTNVDAYDLALIRYCVPALILLPILIRNGFLPKTVPPALILAMVIGGGFPFGLLVMFGATAAPVSHIAVLIPGTMPIFVAVLAYLALGDILGPRKQIGFGIITLGVGLIGWEAVTSMGWGTVLGDLILVFAAFLWGVYSIAFRRSGMSAWHAAAMICFWSSLLAVVIWVFNHGEGLWQAPIRDLVIQFVWQGLLAGVFGMWVYGYAMQKIGPAPAATIGALVPALAAFGAWAILGETPTAVAAVGVALTMVGVIIANWPSDGPRKIKR